MYLNEICDKIEKENSKKEEARNAAIEAARASLILAENELFTFIKNHHYENSEIDMPIKTININITKSEDVDKFEHLQKAYKELENVSIVFTNENVSQNNMFQWLSKCVLKRLENPSILYTNIEGYDHKNESHIDEIRIMIGLN